MMSNLQTVLDNLRAVIDACITGDIEFVKKCVEGNIIVQDLVDDEGYAVSNWKDDALWRACEHDNHTIVEYLLENIKYPSLQTIIEILVLSAKQRKSFLVIKLLITKYNVDPKKLFSKWIQYEYMYDYTDTQLLYFLTLLDKHDPESYDTYWLKEDRCWDVIIAQGKRSDYDGCVKDINKVISKYVFVENYYISLLIK